MIMENEYVLPNLIIQHINYLLRNNKSIVKLNIGIHYKYIHG